MQRNELGIKNTCQLVESECTRQNIVSYLYADKPFLGHPNKTSKKNFGKLDLLSLLMPLTPSPESLFQHGQALLSVGQTEAAQKAFRGAGRICKHGPSLLEIGHALHQTGDLSGAMATFRRASAHDKSLSEASERVGALLMEMGGAQAAVLVLRTAINDHPNTAILHFRLAQALTRVERPQEAYTQAQRAQVLAPDADEVTHLLQQLQPLIAQGTTRGRKTMEMPPAANPLETPVDIDDLIPITDVLADSTAPVADAHTTSSAAMTSDLTEFQLPELLQLLVSRRATGKMEVFSGDRKGVIGLILGKLVQATHNKVLPLYPYLCDRFDLEKDAATITATQDGLIAVELSEQNILEEAEIRVAITDRITASLKVMMAWQNGYSSFVRATPEELGETFEVALDTQWAVFEAFRQLDEENAANAGS